MTDSATTNLLNLDCPTPIDKVFCWLTRVTPAHGWSLVLVLVAIGAMLDYTSYDFELCIATLYIVPITLACWMFPVGEGIAVTIGVTVLALLKYPLLHTDPSLALIAGNGLARIVAFAFLAMMVMSFRRAYNASQYLGKHDRMTGALNKEAFNRQASEALAQAKRSGSMLMLSFLDLDGFKGLNDRKGHEAGDEILQQFSEGAAAELRRGDCFGRVGGDEFAILMPVKSAKEAQDLAASLHRRLSALLATSAHEVTCSMGALIVPPGDTQTRRELMREADRLMYAAKHSGKNAVCIGTAALPASVVMLRPQTQWPAHYPVFEGRSARA